MTLFITCDIYWETKIDKVLDALIETGYDNFFEKQEYGDSLVSIGVVLMCQDPALNLKRRIRFSKKTRELGMDIMLDRNQFLSIDQKEREKIVVQELITEIPLVVSKYKLPDFDLPRFEKDLKRWMSKILK